MKNRKFSLPTNPKTTLDLSKEFEVPTEDIISRRWGKTDLLVFKRIKENEE